MNVAIFCQSIAADFNNENAHFIRGICSEFNKRGYQVRVLEKEKNQPVLSVIKEYGKTGINEFKRYYPFIHWDIYQENVAEINAMISNADLVIADSSVSPATLSLIGSLKTKLPFSFLLIDSVGSVFCDPIHPAELKNIDIVFAGSSSIETAYKNLGFSGCSFIVPAAVDLDIYKPRKSESGQQVAFFADWNETTDMAKIEEYFIEPVKYLRIKAKVFGGNYPKSAKKLFNDANIDYFGWVPGFKMPELLTAFIATVHIPTNKETEAATPGITILRAQASGSPVLSAPLKQNEKILTPGRDFLVANDGYEMKHFILEMMNSTLKEVIIGHGYQTVSTKHSSKVRVDQIENIFNQLGINKSENSSKLVMNG